MALKRSASVYFDPSGSDLEVFLGHREAALMKIGWKHGPLTVKRALHHMGKKNVPAYTTVMTILSRLAEKGLMTRKRDGRHFVYQTAIDRKTFLEERITAITTCLKVNFSEFM